MEAGLLCPCYSSSQLLGYGFQFSGHLRTSSESSCLSSCTQLSSTSHIIGMGRSLARQRMTRQGKDGPSALTVRCQDWSHFKLPNQPQRSGDANKKAEGGGVNRLPGHHSSPQGSWDGRQGRINQVSPPGLGQFRPPPNGWVPDVEESEEERNTKESRKAELLQKLCRGLGSWQEKAGYIKEVQQLGGTSEEIYELTFVAVVKQTALVVALQVYGTLVESAASTDTLDWFDEDTVEILYALRTLSAHQRKTAADFVMKNALNAEEAQELARAIKDHERRRQGREGFTTAAGDCLAFSCYRAAAESTDPEVRGVFVERGRRVAETESARKRFDNM